MADLMTRTAFAATMGVHKSQVTYWAGRGMPTAADGKVDPTIAAPWVRENVASVMRESRSRGAAQIRAGEIAQWERSLSTAYYIHTEYAAKHVAGLLTPLLPEEMVRSVVSQLLRVLRQEAAESLDQDIRCPTGKKSWSEDDRFRGDQPREFSWDELLGAEADA